MRAVYMKEPGDVSLIEQAKPEVRSGDVLIRIQVRRGPDQFPHLAGP